MQAGKLAVAAAAIVTMAGCASGPDATPQAQCQFFAMNQGWEFVRVVSSAPGADGTNVEMELKDAVGRDFKATCVNSAVGKNRWLNPLPANAVRRGPA